VSAPVDREELRAARTAIESADGAAVAVDAVLVASFFQVITRVVDANDHKMTAFATTLLSVLMRVDGLLKAAQRNRRVIGGVVGTVVVAGAAAVLAARAARRQ